MSHVYDILADNGEVKVGVSGTPYARLSKIKREYGPRRGFLDAKLIGFVTTDAYLVVESHVHMALADHAVGGEWYRIDPGIAFRRVVVEATLLDDSAAVHDLQKGERESP